MGVQYEASVMLMWTRYAIKENYQNGCHLNNIGHSDLI